MRVTPIEINWHPKLSIFASESFLRAVGDEYGWIGGIDSFGKLRCILPYTIIRKAIFRMVRFRVETLLVDQQIGIDEEKAFLNMAVEYFRSIGADMIIPATTNSIFRTYPDKAIAAPYGSYISDLSQQEDVLWSNISKKYRKDIRSAINKGVRIKSGVEYKNIAYSLVRETFKRSGLPFMGFDAFDRMVSGLGEKVKVMIAEYQGVAQSCTVYPFSDFGAYAVYGGSISKPVPGSMKLLQWEAMRQFRQLGVKRYDFVGARINPEKGSKQEGIMLFKQYLGGKPVQGYIWKYPLNRLKYAVYLLAIRLQRGGDIVDYEGHKLGNY
jgi:lipid II:glycine glycyltransferase (peptidoglycan interpeptide bridge formation enzyme)